jgi:hypothetical protein
MSLIIQRRQDASLLPVHVPQPLRREGLEAWDVLHPLDPFRALGTSVILGRTRGA